MKATDELICPVSGCTQTGSLSQVIHHITESDDSDHTWNALGYDNSYDFRVARADADQESSAARLGEQTDGDKTTPNDEKLTGVELQTVPGIGGTRASTLREHGYEAAIDVANASVGELSEVPSFTEKSAQCIRITSREACGFQRTFVSELADSLGVERSKVRDAYGSLAPAIVTPSEAEPTLRELFEGDENSIMNLEECAIRHRHFLYEVGFERIADVASASVDELTKGRYIGESTAKNIRAKSRRILDKSNESAGLGDSQNGSADLEQADNGTELGTDSESEDNGSRGNNSKSNSKGGLTSNPDDDECSELDDGMQPEEESGSDHQIDYDGEIPQGMRSLNQWSLWKKTDDGRKIPRAPWNTGDPLEFVSAMDSENWTTFEQAVSWKTKLPQEMELAFTLTRDDEFVFLDLDDVVIDGNVSASAQELIEDADSYAALSTSGTGVHIFGRGELSEKVKSVTGPLSDSGEQSLEVYDRNRFVAITADHIEGTPREATPVDSLLERLENEFATVSTKTPDRATIEPKRSRSDLQEIETTSDIQDVFDAISQTRPSDIKMRSTRTKTHGDGTYSYDPSWVHSKSGTRLGVLEDLWIYREGMIALNALQVVALEERIITDERAYPEGEDFWKAVEALRERGAHIPKYEPDGSVGDEPASEDPKDDINSWEIATRLNYGEPVRTHVHRYDRDYQERLALKLAPVLTEAAESLYLSPKVAYRAGEVYAAGHAAGVVPGGSHESTLGAALRVASIEAGTPRPLKLVAQELDASPKTIRKKFSRLLHDTAITDAIDANDLVVDPVEYIPFLAHELGVHEDEELQSTVRALLEQNEFKGGANPMSEVAAAYYVAMKRLPDHNATQRRIADAADLSTVTIRNNYRKFTE